MMLLADCLAGRLSRYSHTCYAFPASVWHLWTDNTDVTWQTTTYMVDYRSLLLSPRSLVVTQML